MEEQISYRLILILENIPHSATSYLVRLDNRTLELTDDEPILAVYTEAGIHNIEVSSSPTVRESASFRIQPGQRITKVFVRPTAHRIDLDIDIGRRARGFRNRESAEEEYRPASAPAPGSTPSPAPVPAQAQASSRNGMRAAWLAFTFLLGLVCGLLLSLAIWPARARASSTGPAQALEGPALSDAPGAGDFAIEIRSVRRTTDAAGDPAVVVAYVWTNNSGGTVNAAELFQARAFQAGVQLDPAEIYDVGLYDPTAYTRQLRPDAATELQSAFLLTSERVPVEFEITPLPGVSGEAVLEEFAPSELE